MPSEVAAPPTSHIRQKSVAARTDDSDDVDDFRSVSEGGDDGRPATLPEKTVVEDSEKKEQGTLEETAGHSEIEREQSLNKLQGEQPDEAPPLYDIAENGGPSSSSHKRQESAASKRFSAQMKAQRLSMGSKDTPYVSMFSHHRIISKDESELKKIKGDNEDDHDNKEDEWQTMPAFASYDIYDDDGKLIAKGVDGVEEEQAGYSGLGGAGRGYTRVQVDDDAKSATSMDENTAYLFKDPSTTAAAEEDDEEMRDPMSQMQATKNILTDNQKIAYVGVVRLAQADMIKEISDLERTKGARKQLDIATESLQKWSQRVMLNIYSHMELDSAEQMMIEQLAGHGLKASDLTPTLMANARVQNPAADSTADKEGKSPESNLETKPDGSVPNRDSLSENDDDAPPPYQPHRMSDEDLPEVRTPSQMPHSERIDIDIRWTVLCDLFLVLISEAQYDSRSRCLLERVGEYLDVPWLDIARFEKRVTDALEMDETEQAENWDETENMKNREKRARKRRLIYMGLATVGGGLIIGLSAGALAPLIGAGLATGFTAIGVTGTSGFLAGAGGAAIIGGSSAIAGGTIGVKAANRRTGAVKTFEYRPLHNNKRVNLIVTIAGWITGKVDDVRLPFSTVDPIMGDIYSIHWEPEMLRSMGATINILATEALTQTIQQVLGSTILMSLMAALQLPIVLSKLAYLIDNPWSVSLARADAAGLILADSLIERNLGARPITLVGFSVGARVIFACLKELSKRGAVGLIQNVYLFGSPVVVNKDEYLKARAIVSGRFVNAYATNDWILGYLFRATGGGIMRVAGLAKVPIPGIENVDVTTLVKGHMAYRTAMPRLLREVGWAVESDEFTEIEDPDPENFEQRQRELINEIEEARKELEKKPEKKSRWGWFSSKKRGEKKAWETYDDSIKNEAESRSSGQVVDEQGRPVEFDVEAIRREAIELASQGIDVKQLETSMPSMKLDTSVAGDSSSGLRPPGPLLRPSRSYDGRSKTFNSRPSPVASNSYEYEPEDGFFKPGHEKVTMTFDLPASRDKSPASLSPIVGPSKGPVKKKKSHDSMPSRQGSVPNLANGSPGGTPAPFGSAAATSSPSQKKSNLNAWDDDDEFEDRNGGEKEMTMTFE